MTTCLTRHNAISQRSFKRFLVIFLLALFVVYDVLHHD